MITQVSERGQLAEATASLALARKIEEVTSQVVADQTQKLAETERKADRLEQELIKAKSKNDRVTPIRDGFADLVCPLTSLGERGPQATRC